MKKHLLWTVCLLALILALTTTSALGGAFMPRSADTTDGYYEVLGHGLNTDRPLGIGASDPVGDSYFDDAVFIGDSVTLKLRNYVKENHNAGGHVLGDVKFLAMGSMGSGNAMEKVTSESIHPSYQGQKMSLEDAVAKMKAKKVYIMLGMNDVAVYGAAGAAENLMKLVGLIRDKSPKAEIFIQTATPRIHGVDKKPGNKALFEYDLELYRLYREMKLDKVYLVDVAYVMRDAEGYLPDLYCSDPEDMGLHFSDEACAVWLDYLYTHVPEEG